MMNSLLNRLWPGKDARHVPAALILMYHRVADIHNDPWKLSVTPRHFSEQMEVLRRIGRTVELERVGRFLAGGKLPERSVAVTFDDGYFDILTTAKPLLERFGIPATFFVTSGCGEGNQAFWWDELERLIIQPATLPESLQVMINGISYSRDFKHDKRHEEGDALDRLYGGGLKSVPALRRELYYSLWGLMKPLDRSDREKVLADLRQWSGASPDTTSACRILNTEEIRLLGKGDLFEIGSHSVSHRSLPESSIELQRSEILESKRALEEITAGPVTAFSYPFGNIDKETPVLVQEAGYHLACTTHSARVDTASEPFRLPRVAVPDLDGDEFEEWLLEWMTPKPV